MRSVYLVGAVCWLGVTADAQTFRTPTLGGEACTVTCPAGPKGDPGAPGPQGPQGPVGPKGEPWTPPVCAPLPALDLPLTAPTFIAPGDCAAYVLGYLGTTAYLVDLRGLRYQALPAPLSGHAMTATTSASPVDPWLIMASDSTGLWLVRVTPAARWTPLP